MKRIICAAVISLLAGAAASAQQSARSASERPDLSGIWSTFPGVNPVSGLKREVSGVQETRVVDRTAIRGVVGQGPGVLPWTAAPSYKPEFQAKVKELDSLQSKTDPVFYCARPGLPRVGPPRRIIQLANEMVFLYEDMSGDPYRIIPTDGRQHRANANPSYYGDSVGRWEGDTLVIDARNFVEDTWFGEKGYFHTDAMRVTERLWRDGENLVWQVTVEDPNVLTGPWTMAPRMVKRSTQALEESPACHETDGALLRNNDHHDQR